MLRISFNFLDSRRRRITMIILLALVCLKISAGTLSSDFRVELSTDRACYNPGQTVMFTADGDVPSNTIVRYRHGLTVVEEHKLNDVAKDNKWTWTPPSTDFKGYMVDLYYPDNGNEVIIGTIAVDVSSDWTRFPRYGFVADFDNKNGSIDKDANIEAEMKYLNRLHINGVQFQDWHWMHHEPVKFNGDGSLTQWYQDVSNRWVGIEYVKKYIEVQHSYGMKSIFYNLCFGAWKGAENDGVKEEWNLYAYDGKGNRYQDFHKLPDDWQSNIYLENPGNAGWQAYMKERNSEVYGNFGFDGYQIDQLGGRGDRYDSDNNKVDLPSGYASFINAMKAAHPDKRLVMNAVSGYGAENILKTGKVDFCYNEVWGNGNGYGDVSEDAFANLYEIIKNNDRFSDHTLRTVFAAYMNYDKADRGDLPDNEKFMNTPGVLLTDAVMFALGGSHLELGDHMLSREYFPAAPLAMTDELKTAMIRYYDFITAYQNLLRDASSKFAFPVTACTTASGVDICAWPPQLDHVVTFAKTVGTSKVIHFLNFKGINDNLSWRDVNGTRPKPTTLSSLPMSVDMPQTVKRVWVATPDAHGGAPQELSFVQEDGKVTFTLPSLEYWSMVVFELGKVEDRLLIVGDATESGWDTGKATRMDANEDGSAYTTTVRLEAGSNDDGTLKAFKFINGTDYGTCTHYNAEYENFNFNEQYNINTANIIANTNAAYDNGANDYKFTVAETGNYHITVNLNTMRIQVDKADVTLVTVGETGYATYCSDMPLDFSGMEGRVKAYIATGTASSGTGDVMKLVVQNVEDVRANTGLLLHGTPGRYAVPRGAGSYTYLNYFKSVTTPTYVSAEDSGNKNFLLADGSQGIGFYPAQDGIIPANRAYLSLPVSSVSSARAFVIDFATGINGVTAAIGTDSDIYYTVTGVRVHTLSSPGLYICNGRKVIVR